MTLIYGQADVTKTFSGKDIINNSFGANLIKITLTDYCGGFHTPKFYITKNIKTKSIESLSFYKILEKKHEYITHIQVVE